MTQKNKNIVLIGVFIILVVLSYKYAISNTLQLKQEYKTLKQDAIAFNNMPLQLSSLKKKENYLDSLLNKYQLDEGSIQNSMLKTINTYAESKSLKVIDFIEPHSLVQNDITVKTYQFTLEGDYNSIISLIHQMEQNTKYGEIINLNFQKKKNYRTGRYFLQLQVLLKSFG